MDAERVDLRKLKTFQLVAELGSLRRAASRLNLTISAVSFSIRRLEEDLGIKLVERLPNRLTLTDAGRSLARSIPEILKHIERTLDGISAATELRGRLSISTSSDLAWYFMPRIITYMDENPAVDVDVLVHKSSEAIELVTSGETDIAIGRFPELEAKRGSSPVLEWEPIVPSTFGILCRTDSPLINQRRRPRLAEIAQYPIVTLPRDFAARRIIASAFERARLKPRKWIEVASCSLAPDYVEQGLGLGIIHSLCAQEFRRALEFLSMERFYGTLTFAAIYRRNSSSERVRLEISKMLETLTQDNKEILKADWKFKT